MQYKSNEMMTSSETFRWHYYIFDVTNINADISFGVLKGISVVLPRATIEWYSENILGVTNREARLVPQVPPINMKYAKRLVAPRINDVIVLTQIQRFSNDSNELSAGLDYPGTLSYDPFAKQILKPENFSTADIVVIDGNHRTASAYYNGKQSMDGVLLTIDQLGKYLRNQC